MEAGTLNCPECGAAVSTDAVRCQYCQALLQTTACPKCMGMMFTGSKFCPHCGARTQTIAVAEESQNQCPRCHEHLQRITVGQTPLEECMHCGGMWIDAASFDHICNSAEDQAAAAGLTLPPPTAINVNVSYIECPTCHNLMNRVNYADRSRIIINVCKAHGIWLDRDELREIIEFIRGGGLAWSHRQNDADAARHDEIQRLNARTAAGLAVPIGYDHLGNDCGGLFLGGLASVIRALQ